MRGRTRRGKDQSLPIQHLRLRLRGFSQAVVEKCRGVRFRELSKSLILLTTFMKIFGFQNLYSRKSTAICQVFVRQKLDEW